MRISRERLETLSTETGFEARILEKVMRLYGILNAFQDHPFLEGKFSLKGGTAINLFLSSIPRLSVDIDLNYIGSSDKEIMLAERPQIERVIEAVLGREDLRVTHKPAEYAGGK